MNEFTKQIPIDKTEIRAHNKLIPMSLFLSFLTVPVEKSTDHPGADMGWTKYVGDYNLVISGGVVNNTEYLHNIQYQGNINNKFNHFVNVFDIWHIFNDEGHKFFIEYYKDEIEKIRKVYKEKYKIALERCEKSKFDMESAESFWEDIRKVYDK